MSEPELTEAQREALDFALFEGASMDGATVEAILDRLDPTVARMVAAAEQTAAVIARAEVVGWLHDHAKGRPHPQEDYIRAVLEKARAALDVDVQPATTSAAEWNWPPLPDPIPGNPYDEDDYCHWCGSGEWKPHGLECAWADAMDGRR